MQTQDKTENPILESKQVHKNTSYYNSDGRLSEEAKTLIQSESLLNDPNGPRLVKSVEAVSKAGKKIEINKYSFMNDGIWIKAIIELEKYPALKTITAENMKCTFETEGFDLEIKDPNSEDVYALVVPKTREPIIPDKSKYYIRKDKIYVALYKEKEQDWWTLKAV